MNNTRKRISKKFNDEIINKALFNYNKNKNIGKLIVEYQSGVQYHYNNVDLHSVNALFDHTEKYAFTAHNKYIESRYSDKKVLYTKKWHDKIAEERRKQYLAKNNAARRARKEKLKQKKKEEKNAKLV